MSVNKIIIEDFKIFEGQHIFDLKNLNVFTGANNSGKSTLFKAISWYNKYLDEEENTEAQFELANIYSLSGKEKIWNKLSIGMLNQQRTRILNQKLALYNCMKKGLEIKPIIKWP